jgi:hypothetical protein
VLRTFEKVRSMALMLKMWMAMMLYNYCYYLFVDAAAVFWMAVSSSRSYTFVYCDDLDDDLIPPLLKNWVMTQSDDLSHDPPQYDDDYDDCWMLLIPNDDEDKDEI